MRSKRFVIPAGNRFVVFAAGAVDLAHHKIAWAQSLRAYPARTQPNTVAIWSQRVSGLELFDLLNGGGPTFVGQPVSHQLVDSDSVALARSTEVAIVDTVQAREVVRLPTPSLALSVIRSGERYYVLVDREALRTPEVRPGSVLSFDQFGAPLGSRDVEIVYGTLTPEPTPQFRSQPYLTRSDESGVMLSLVDGCPMCPGSERTPIRLYRRAVEAAGDSPWRTDIVDAGDSLIRDDFIADPPAPPPDLRPLKLANPALIGEVSPRGSAFVTGNAARSCVWSVPHAERTSCVDGSRKAPLPTAAPSCDAQIDAPDAAAQLPDTAIPITRAGRLIAVAYDLTDTAWAIVLPDGRFSGSPDAAEYLAFYHPGGELLGTREVSTLQLTRTQMAAHLSRELTCDAD